MSIPVLPETAPFNASQRAWLNGFFAGLLGIEGEAAGMATATTATAVAEVPSTVEAEDHPWHDPALPLAARLALAEGRPLPDRLMASMAQLDCGACGYVRPGPTPRRSRAARRRSLSKCSPGGKETMKTLKALVAESRSAVGNGATTKTASTTGAPPKHAATASSYNRANPFPARLISASRLNRPGSSKDTRHVTIDLGGSGLSYKPGDALGVFPENCPEFVDEILLAIGAERRLDLRSTLLREAALGRPSDELLEHLVECATDPDEAAHLSRLRDSDDDWIETADVLDVLHRHRSARPDPEEFAALLGKLQPRLYSISSSLKTHPGEVHLTVGMVRYEKDGRPRKGVASTYLGERLSSGDEVRVFLHPSHRFQLPDHGDAPMIMVGPGTGVAPFRAFLEERQALGCGGKNWLFFGDQCRATDFLYEDELLGFQKHGVLTRLDVAFSRDQVQKVYVQDRMRDRGRELYDWLEDGAHVYVCGDAKRMASDVDKALHVLIAEHGSMSADKAKAYVSKMTKAGRYQRDVY